MTDHSDFERDLTDALRQRTSSVTAATPDLDGVWAHVDRRSRRRRHVAVAGSVAVVGLGVLGFAAIGSTDANQVPGLAAASSPDAPTSAWRCTDQLDYVVEGSTGVYFADCELVTIEDAPPLLGVPSSTDHTTVTSPGGYDLGYCEEVDDSGVAVSVPCTTLAPTTTSIVLLEPPTTEVLDPNVDDPVYSPDGPICSNGSGGVVECALVDGEQQYTVIAGDSITSIARRYRLSMRTLVAYNEWPDGDAHLIFPGDIVLIPPFPGPFATDATVPTSTSIP